MYYHKSDTSPRKTDARSVNSNPSNVIYRWVVAIYRETLLEDGKDTQQWACSGSIITVR